MHNIMRHFHTLCVFYQTLVCCVISLFCVGSLMCVCYATRDPSSVFLRYACYANDTHVVAFMYVSYQLRACCVTHVHVITCMHVLSIIGLL